MSHFTVAVMIKDKNKLEEVLAPYDENLEVAPYIYKTKEELIESSKKMKQMYLERQGKGEILEEFQLKYTNATTDEELYEAYIDEDCIYDEQGNELTTYNENAKWDWYEIGGRWRNLLLTKADNEDVIQEMSLTDLFHKNPNLFKEAPEGFKWVDGARIKDICFDKMFNDEYEKAIRWWELVVEEQPLREGEEKPFNLYKKEYLIERYGTKEHYAEIQSTFHTYAFADETGWYEKGSMGWFGCDNATKDSEEVYLEKFQEYIKAEENQDKYLIIVDCHI